MDDYGGGYGGGGSYGGGYGGEIFFCKRKSIGQ